MTRQGILGTERKCRSCARWNYFKVAVDMRRCPDCGAEYGKPGLGLDVPHFKSPAVRIPGKKPEAAMKVPKPKPGEFGAR